MAALSVTSHSLNVTSAACCGYCCPGCTRLDRWVNGMGGFAGAQYIALCREAREVAGPGMAAWRYLELAQQVDEEHEIELADAASARAASRRADAAAAACLRQSAEIQLAMDELRTHPAVAAVLEASARPDLTRAEIESGLRTAMGLAAREPAPYEVAMPPVSDLARQIGIRR